MHSRHSNILDEFHWTMFHSTYYWSFRRRVFSGNRLEVCVVQTNVGSRVRESAWWNFMFSSSWVDKRQTVIFARVTVCLRGISCCPGPSVFHRSEFCRYGWTDRTGFWCISWLRPVLQRVVRKFGYLHKEWYSATFLQTLILENVATACRPTHVCCQFSSRDDRRQFITPSAVVETCSWLWSMLSVHFNVLQQMVGWRLACTSKHASFLEVLFWNSWVIVSEAKQLTQAQFTWKLLYPWDVD